MLSQTPIQYILGGHRAARGTKNLRGIEPPSTWRHPRKRVFLC
nr:MAG TPA: PrmC N-terminal domain [Caudoviricetes sp.]